MGIRPEAITLNTQGDESQRCSVRHVAYMGSQYEVSVIWHGQSLLLQVNATQLQPNVGDDLYLHIHAYGIFILNEGYRLPTPSGSPLVAPFFSSFVFKTISDRFTAD